MKFLFEIFKSKTGKGPSWRIIAAGFLVAAIYVLPMFGQSETADIVKVEQTNILNAIEQLLKAIGILIIIVDKIRASLKPIN